MPMNDLINVELYMITYEKYFQLLSNMSAGSASSDECKQVEEFQNAQPEKCPQCGANLNEKSCGCVPPKSNATSGAFVQLKQLWEKRQERKQHG